MPISADLCFFDIETLPTDRADLIAEIAAGVTHPGSMKKPETIAAWEENDKSAAVAEAVSKTALDGSYGRVASIAWAIADGQVYAGTSAGPDGYDVEIERILIEGFFAAAEEVKALYRVPPTLVGHCIATFDIRFLWKRAVVLGIPVPEWWPTDARPWDRDRMQDTMVMWEGARGWISQDRLAKILGLPGKGDIDGSKVAELWEAGRFEDVRQYNADDVRTARAIWCRINGEPIPAEEVFLIEDQDVKEVFSMEPMVRELHNSRGRDGKVVPVFLKGLLPSGTAA